MIATLIVGLVIVLWVASVLFMVYRVIRYAMKASIISLEDVGLGVILVVTAPIVVAVHFLFNTDDIIIWRRKP